MNKSKRKRLEAAGWAIGSADDFLGLSPVESALVELRLALSQALKERRTKLRISQAALATLIKSSQSRVAKMEAADPEVSFELLLRGLFATGATRRDVATVVDPPRRERKRPSRSRDRRERATLRRRMSAAARPGAIATAIPAPRPSVCTRPGRDRLE